jgi:hypothetical protein
MFCSDCGQPASGKFCSSCGHPLERPPQSIEDESNDDTPTDRSTLTNYQTLLSIPQVRDRIAHHASRAKKKLTGEEFLAHCDNFLTPLTGGVPLTLISKIAQPLSLRLGLKTGKTRTERLAQPPGTPSVAVLCSFAHNNHTLGEVTQLENGVTLRAAAPSDIWSFKGDLHIDIRAAGKLTQIEAAYTIPGQLIDWGKSQRGLNQLFTEITTQTRAA